MLVTKKKIKAITLKHIKSKCILKKILDKVELIKLLNIIRYNKKI